MADEFIDTKELKKFNKKLNKISEKLNKTVTELPPGILQDLTLGAHKIRNTVIESLMEGGKTGKEYRRGKKIHKSSAPGEAPATDSGELVRTIIFDVRPPLEVEIGSRGGAPYARALEFGHVFKDGREIEARPYLGPAVDKHEAEILSDIGEGVFEVIRQAVKEGTQ